MTKYFPRLGLTIRMGAEAFAMTNRHGQTIDLRTMTDNQRKDTAWLIAEAAGLKNR